jgi:large exoprotein involved in heme utilization and adhesion
MFQSTRSAVTTTAQEGKGGLITLSAAGTIDLTATDISATVGGGRQPGGSLTLTTPTLTITGGSLAAETRGAGPAGNIALHVGTLAAQETTLTSSSTETATGDAGTVTIQGLGGPGTAASRVTLRQSTLRTAADGTGAGGAVTVAASEALTLDHATLSATVHDGLDTSGGLRGDLTLRAPVLTLLGPRIEAETTGTRRAGDITLNVGSLMAQGATLTSSSTGAATGDAGTVRIQGPGGIGTTATRVTLTGSVVATEASVADGGDIQVQAQDTLRLRDSQITTAVRSGQGHGGNILIDPEFVILERSRIVANAFGGRGGNIQIVAQGFVTDAASKVSASSAKSAPGIIDIQAVTTPIGLVAPSLPTFASAASLLRSPCAARLHEGTVSTLVERGRDGVPATPDGVLPSRLPLAPLDTATLTHDGGLPSAALVWPQGESQRDLSASLSLRGWAASVAALRLLPGDCASR